MNFIDLLSAITDYGITTVIAVLTIYYIFLVSQKRIIKITKENELKEFRDELSKSFTQTKEINDNLAELMMNIKSDRVYIYQYHNGGKNVCGLSFKKISNTHQITMPGITNNMVDMQNIPISMFAYSNEYVEKKEIFVINAKELKEDNSLYLTLKHQGIQSMAIVGIYNGLGEPVGFIGADYISKSLSEEEKSHIKDYIILKSYLLAGYFY